jgi:polysaccharide biosynthesis protein PslG
MPIRPLNIIAAIALSIAAASCTAQRSAGPWSLPAGPDSMGVNIHFTDAKPGEMKMIADGGFRWVRMDFAWAATEREKGKYDFAAYDRLVDACDARHIRIMFILDYANNLYDKGLSPSSDEGRMGFASWASAAAMHFQGRGILWEMYNEPNIGFWTPKPNVQNYIALAKEVGKAFRAAAPGEVYIGPAVSEMDYPFLEACFQAGMLEYWSAVTVHPYLSTQPENAAAHYRKLGLMIEKYAPKGKYIPIISGEWGYSAARAGLGDENQAKMLVREFLTNMGGGVPVSIWYDWHNDGADPKDIESNFGTVRFPLLAGKEPPYEPKPAYIAARVLAEFLDPDNTRIAAEKDAVAGTPSAAPGKPAATLPGPFRFARRVAAGDINDYVYLFTRGSEQRLAVWTTADIPHEIVIPVRPGVVAPVTGMLGSKSLTLIPDAAGLKITITGAPQYLAPAMPGPMLR